MPAITFQGLPRLPATFRSSPRQPSSGSSIAQSAAAAPSKQPAAAGEDAATPNQQQQRTFVTRASATTCRPRKKMSVCSSTLARPASCAFLRAGRQGGVGARDDWNVVHVRKEDWAFQCTVQARAARRTQGMRLGACSGCLSKSPHRATDSITDAHRPSTIPQNNHLCWMFKLSTMSPCHATNSAARTHKQGSRNLPVPDVEVVHHSVHQLPVPQAVRQRAQPQRRHQHAVHNDVGIAARRGGKYVACFLGCMSAWGGTGSGWSVYCRRHKPSANAQTESTPPCHATRRSEKGREFAAGCAHRRMGDVKCVYSGAARP